MYCELVPLPLCCIACVCILLENVFTESDDTDTVGYTLLPDDYEITTKFEMVSSWKFIAVHTYTLASGCLRAYKLSLERPISKLKHTFSSYLIGLSKNVLRVENFLGPKMADF